MARFILSRTARADLTHILRTSLERWGEAGRARYEALLAAAMERTAANPLGPTTKPRSDVFHELRSFHIRHARRGRGVGAPVHVIYYRAAAADTIEILRVLHENMQPELHLAPPAAPRRRSRKAQPARKRKP